VGPISRIAGGDPADATSAPEAVPDFSEALTGDVRGARIGVPRALLESGEDIGLATVYRVLHQFETAGLVVKHNFEGGQAYYELDSGQHHDHMVCVETGKVVEFVSAEIEELQEKIAAAHGYEIADHSLVLYVRPKRKPHSKS
jgi:Fur family ferric uptake transcriptional regulator